MKASSLEQLPNFFIIGAMKSGTTSLYDLLIQHPQVYFPFAKELKFFSRDTSYSQGIEWYRKRYFRRAGAYPLRGDDSPQYLYWGEKVAPRIKQTYGDSPVKFIAIFRDPVQRAYSHYWTSVRNGNENLSFVAALEAEDERLRKNAAKLETEGTLIYGYNRASCYASLLQPFLARFPREQFHFILLDDLRSDFTRTMEDLAGFLGIQPGFAYRPVASNRSHAPRNRILHEFMENPSGPLYKLLRAIFLCVPPYTRYKVRRSVVKLNRRVEPYPPLDPVTEQMLRERYTAELRKLEVLTGRDLRFWYHRGD